MAGASSAGTVSFVPAERGLQPEGLRPPRGVAASGFRPLRKIPHCCLPQESGPCLSPSVADRPLRPATRRSLGEPLPHQLADRPRGPPEAPEHFLVAACAASGTSGISRSFPRLSPSSGQVPHVLLTRSPLDARRHLVRLACVRPAASVRPEPGSNSPSTSRARGGEPPRTVDLCCVGGISLHLHSWRAGRGCRPTSDNPELLGRPRRTGLRRGHPHWHSSSLPFSRSAPVDAAHEGSRTTLTRWRPPSASLSRRGGLRPSGAFRVRRWDAMLARCTRYRNPSDLPPARRSGVGFRPPPGDP